MGRHHLAAGLPKIVAVMPRRVVLDIVAVSIYDQITLRHVGFLESDKVLA